MSDADRARGAAIELIALTKRYAAGWQLQANYTYSKVMSDAAGDSQVATTTAERMADLFDRPERVTRVPNDLSALEALIQERRRV